MLAVFPECTFQTWPGSDFWEGEKPDNLIKNGNFDQGAVGEKLDALRCA